MPSKINSGLFTSNQNDWCTPPEFLDRVRRHLGIIGLDPCTNDNAVTNAMESWGIDDRSLFRSWEGYGLVYVNPPYGDILTWAAKLAAEGGAMDRAEIVALLPSRTDTAWWHDYIVPTANAIAFIRGRLRFLGAPSSAPFPSTVAYWGRRITKFEMCFEDTAWIVRK